MTFSHTHTQNGYLQGMAQVIQKADEARKAIEVPEYLMSDQNGAFLPASGMNAIRIVTSYGSSKGLLFNQDSQTSSSWTPVEETG
jgi:hypothetical protein